MSGAFTIMNKQTGFFNAFSNKPFAVVAITLSLYAAWFVLPFLFDRPDVTLSEESLVGLDKVLAMFSEKLIVMFGLFHYVNMLDANQMFVPTTYQVMQTTSTADVPLSGLLALSYVLPAFLYGLFVCWRWSVRNRQVPGLPS